MKSPFNTFVGENPRKRFQVVLKSYEQTKSKEEEKGGRKKTSKSLDTQKKKSKNWESQG